MKIINCFFIFLSATTSCCAQQKNYSLEKIKKKISEINNNRKSINIIELKNRKNELEGNSRNTSDVSDTAFMKKSSTYFYKFYDGGYILDEYNEKKEKVRETKLRPDGKVEVHEKIDAYFTYNETYFPPGDIATKNISSSLGFVVGMKYEYNGKGKPVKSIDTDEGYTFTFEEVFKFCKDKEMDFETKSFPFRIYKTTRPADKVKLWVIEYPDDKKRKVVTYVLDGLTGIVLNTMENDRPEFIHGR